MSVQVKPYTFFNNTTADADEVNADFDVLYALQAGGIDSANLNLNASYTWGAASIHSFAASNLRVRSAGAGVARINVSSLAADRIFTLPEVLGTSTFIVSEGDQSINGEKSFTSTNGIKIPSATPTENGGIGQVSGTYFGFRNSTQNLLMVDDKNDITITGEKSFDSVNGIKVPNVDPTENRGLGWLGNMLKVSDGSTLLRYLPREKDHVVAYNVRMVLASGEIKFVGDDGSDWSATNPGIFKIYSSTAGKWDEVIFTSSPTFQDATHGVDSDFVGSGTMSLGTAPGVAWSSAMPIFWYVVTDNTTPLIGFSRVPHLVRSGDNTTIGYKDVAPSASDQRNLIFLTTTNITACNNWKTATLIGSSNITKNVSDNWTFQTIDAGQHGILNFKNCTVYFDMPAAQNGGAATAPAASRWFIPNGGTAPQFSTNNICYRIGINGDCHISFQFSGDGGVDGGTAVNLAMSLPFRLAGASVGVAPPMVRAGSAFVTWAAGVNNQMTFPSIQSGTPAHCFFVRNSSTTAVAFINNSDFTNGGREVSGDVRYPIEGWW